MKHNTYQETVLIIVMFCLLLVITYSYLIECVCSIPCWSVLFLKLVKWFSNLYDHLLTDYNFSATEVKGNNDFNEIKVLNYAEDLILECNTTTNNPDSVFKW